MASRPNPIARDYLEDANYRAQLHNRIEQGVLAPSAGIAGGWISYLMENSEATRAFTEHVEAVVTVVFVDGSKVDMQLRVGQQPAYMKGSARDATGGLLDGDGQSNTARTNAVH